MAIFHLSAQIIGRTAGRSSVAAAAYRHGERLVDERTGLVHDYSRKAGVSEVVVLAPDNAPGWVHTPELWQRVEASETRKNSQTAREINIALPVELNPEQRRGLMLGYCREQFVRRGMVADVSFHDDNPENPHAHIMLTTRSIGPDGFGPKVRQWNGPAVLSEWREQWQEHANRALESAGLEVRIDHRSLEAQQADALERGEELEAMKLNRGAQVHEGPKSSERVQVEQRTVAQELAEAQAKAALWEQANPEVVAAMRARADQERVRREEAEKDRAWSVRSRGHQEPGRGAGEVGGRAGRRASRGGGSRDNGAVRCEQRTRIAGCWQNRTTTGPSKSGGHSFDPWLHRRAELPVYERSYVLSQIRLVG